MRANSSEREAAFPVEDRINSLEQALQEEKETNQQLRLEIRDLHQKLDESQQQMVEIKESLSWKILNPIRFIQSKISGWMEKTVLTHKIKKAVHILLHDGWSTFKWTFIRFLNVIRHGRKGFRNKMIMNPDLNALRFDAEYQENVDYSEFTSDVKPLAFYLPQYHTFPENDQWWGKGFTEWVNVKSGDARFEGHYQPRVPHSDFGYYCLTDIETIRKQAVLARQHGIYGFVFYYYWFSGKRLMERPLDLLLKHPEIDLPYCLCWANENWTRAWDGKNKDILIGQEYSEKDDISFIQDMKPWLDDPRYIRIDGKPLIIVYNPGQIPNCHRSFSVWRQKAKELGIGEILIWTCETANNTAKSLKIEDCIDARIEFPPHNMWQESNAIRGVDTKGKEAFLYSYVSIVDDRINEMKTEGPWDVPLHHGIMLGWDNASRRKNGWFTYCGFSLKALYRWMLAVKEKTRKDFKPEERFCFINAWNEWGEGTYLEPDEKYGYSSINTVSRALYGLPLKDDLKIFNPETSVSQPDEESPDRDHLSLAVQIHMFYLDTLEETIAQLNKIPYPFDCYISTDTEGKQDVIYELMKESCNARLVQVKVFENRGRDVAPFLMQMKDVYQQYPYICHIHSKKTKTGEYGDDWRRYVFRHLFGNRQYISRIIQEFENDPKLGIIMPETYPVLELQAEWGGNLNGVHHLLQRMGCDDDLPNDPVFPVGNMFWAKSEALKPIFDLNLQQSDFPQEAGQVNATIAHCIERCWVYMLRANGYSYKKAFNNYPDSLETESRKRIAIFVHYQQNHTVTKEDEETVRILADFMDDVIVVSNSDISDADTKKVKNVSPNITVSKRTNIGMDFGAWRDTLLSLGKRRISQYDEVILCNNSCYPPVLDLREVFSVMEPKRLDFWGNTVFPKTEDGTYINKDYIPEHLQSYFMVFEKRALASDAFWSFWEMLPDYKNYIDVVANCESQFTEILSRAGLRYEPYIRETRYMSKYLNNYALPYEKPSSLLLLRDPFIKKKCYQYMNEEEAARLMYFWKNMQLYQRKETLPSKGDRM